MSRDLKKRIAKLEEIDRPGVPSVVVAMCPLPEDEKPTAETIQKWLAAGVAHIAFRGHAILYDGGRRHPLTIEEWQALHCPTAESLH